MTQVAFQCPTCAIRLPINEARLPFSCCGVRYGTLESLPHAHPSFAQKMVNLAQDTVRHARNRKLVDDATREARREQCLSCVEFFDAATQTCTHPRCGCGMKKEHGWLDALGWASKKCPIGRWNLPIAKGQPPAHVVKQLQIDSERVT